ncbi:MAG TPA: hypothetical protein VH518_07200 [Tepidisphaeraceae bacterium]|jgi:hypothetical protein
MLHRYSTIGCFVAVAAILLGCQSPPPPGRPAGPSQVWDPELVETVLRYQISRSGTDYLPIRRTVYLTVLGDDAPQSLIDQFMGADIRVYKGSDFKVGRGVRHQIDRIQQVDPDRMVVEASWYQNDATLMAFRYQVNRVGGHWKIVQDTVTRAS